MDGGNEIASFFLDSGPNIEPTCRPLGPCTTAPAYGADGIVRTTQLEQNHLPCQVDQSFGNGETMASRFGCGGNIKTLSKRSATHTDTSLVTSGTLTGRCGRSNMPASTDRILLSYRPTDLRCSASENKQRLQGTTGEEWRVVREFGTTNHRWEGSGSHRTMDTAPSYRQQSGGDSDVIAELAKRQLCLPSSALADDRSRGDESNRGVGEADQESSRYGSEITPTSRTIDRLPLQRPNHATTDPFIETHGHGYVTSISVSGHHGPGYRENSTSICPKQRGMFKKPGQILGLTLGGHTHDFVKSRKATMPSEFLYDLHCKPVRLIDWTAAEHLIEQCNNASWLAAWRAARYAVTNPMFLQTNVQPNNAMLPTEALLCNNDITVLLERQYITVFEGIPRAFARAFTVMELTKQRRRFILCPDDFNDLIPHMTFHLYGITLPGLTELFADIFCSYAATGDFDAFFSAFPLPVEVRDFYAFSFGGKYYVPTRVPTGHRLCPLFAHVLTMSMLHLACESLPIRPTAYIDNIRIAGDREAVNLAMSRFVELTNVINADFSIQECGSSYTFLGIVFNHQQATTSIPTKTLDKVAKRKEYIGRDMTARQLLSLLGTLIWCTRIGEPTTQYAYPVIKFLRRRMESILDNPQDLDQPIHLWPCIFTPLKKWSEAVHKNVPRIHYPSGVKKEDVYLFSDASNDGWGAICIAQGNISVSFGPWTTMEKELHINEKEACATVKGARMLKSFTGDCCHIVVDNSSWSGACGNLFQHNYVQYRQKELLMQTLKQAGFSRWTITWIGTLRMLARIHEA